MEKPNQNETKEKGKKVELENTGLIDLPSIDVSPYVGKKVNIENVDEYEGNYGYYIKVETVVVDTLKDIIDKKTDKPLEVRGSRIFGLQEDADGKIGWGEKTKLGVFLKKMGVDHYKDLKGKEVQLQSTTNKEDGKDYLTFN